ncbi:MAG: hypothetical protein IPL28_24515 [Chloroflexi bacterium]|nr:hypothetical protein [Chloroflexota bacterium]
MSTNSLTLNNATITGGNGASGGGILNYNTLTLNNSTVSGNTASGFGGGIYNYGGTLTLNNSTVSGNMANHGGGISNYGTLTLNNSTVSGNTGNSNGGGIHNFAGTTTLNRSMVSGNTSPLGAEIRRSSGTITAADHNVFGHSGQTNAQAFSNFTPGATDITATSDGTTPTVLASILNPTLANNGGSTLTHALVTGSPAIDIVPLDGSVCILDTSTDQRGGVRGSGANRGDGACDAGAYEFNSNQIPSAVTDLLTQTTSQPPTTILALLATLLAAFSGVRLWRRR